MIDKPLVDQDETLDERYTAAWSRQGDSIPSVGDFLASHSDASADECLDVLLSDQRLRWDGGCPKPIDDYLAAYPLVFREPESILKLIQGDFVARLERGETPETASYMQVFPALAEEVRRQCEVDQWLTLRSESTRELATAVDHHHDTGAAGQADDVRGWPEREQPLDTEAPDQADDVRGQRQREQPLDRNQDAPLSGADFQLLRLLGSGGMGEVYEAIQKSIHKHVALKLIRREALDSQSRVRRFFAEARALARLRHPHIVGVHGIGRMADERYFLVMDLVGGDTTLSSLIKAGAVPFDRAAGLVITVAEAIDHTHSRGVIHRDLKPSNVLLDRDGQPHVTDFGLAKIFDATDPDYPPTTAETMLGTPHYMASEQADASRGPITPRTDVYGLGGLLYSLLTGKPPVQGDSLTTILTQVVSPESVLSPRRLRGDIPRELERIALKCLEKNADNRYVSAAAVAKALRSWMANPDQAESDIPTVSPQDKAPGSPGRLDLYMVHVSDLEPTNQDKAPGSPGRLDQGWIPDRSWEDDHRRQRARGWGPRAKPAFPPRSRRRLVLVGTAAATLLAFLIVAPMFMFQPFQRRMPKVETPSGLSRTPESTHGLANIAVRTHQSIIDRFGTGTGSIAIVLDCSGSMLYSDDKDKTENHKFKDAKSAIIRVLRGVPRGTTVSLWTFGQVPQDIATGPDGKPINGTDPRYKEVEGEPELTIQRLRQPARWDPNQVERLRTQLDGLRPWFETPLVEAIVRAAREDLANAPGIRTLLVLTDGKDTRFWQSKTLDRQNANDIPTFIAMFFKTLRIRINIVFFSTDEKKDPELKEARYTFAPALKNLDPPGTFVTTAKWDINELIRDLKRAIQQKLVCQIAKSDEALLPGEPLDVTDALAESDHWWPNGLEPGVYQLRIQADQTYVQKITLTPGERTIFQLVETPNGGIAVARLLDAPR